MTEPDCPHGQEPRTCYICELEAERDRLRTQLQDIMSRGAEAVDMMSAAYGCPDCGVHDACFQIVAERDRLRAVVREWQEAHAVTGGMSTDEISRAIEAAKALAALDVSADMGEGGGAR